MKPETPLPKGLKYDVELVFFPDKVIDGFNTRAVIFRSGSDFPESAKAFIEKAGSGEFAGAGGRRFNCGSFRISKQFGGEGGREKYRGGQWITEEPKNA